MLRKWGKEKVQDKMYEEKTILLLLGKMELLVMNDPSTENM